MSGAAEHDDRIEMRAENIRAGRELGPVFYSVRGKQVAKFAATLKTSNPLFQASSPEGRLAPPTMRLLDYALLIANHFKGGSGGVHAKHWAELHEPMRVGQAVKTSGRITSTWRTRGKVYFELGYESPDAESEQHPVPHA